jgi:hypothetical protein
METFSSGPRTFTSASARKRAPVDRAIAACLAAIEIQNKPMKARVIKESGGDVRAIEAWEPGTRRRLRSRQARPPQQGWAWYVGL